MVEIYGRGVLLMVEIYGRGGVGHGVALLYE
jgi:hypothetical protein